MVSAAKLAYRPLGLVAGIVSGMIAGAIFKQIWRRVATRTRPPMHCSRSTGWARSSWRPRSRAPSSRL